MGLGLAALVGAGRPAPVTGPAWRLLVDPALPGSRNMARDVALLEAAVATASPPTLRLYAWEPACLSLGRHQPESAADLAFCGARGLDVVRRPTGGRTVLHHLELTYSVVAPLGRPPLPRAVQEAYRAVCAALVRATRSFGVDAELTPGEVNLVLPGPRTAVPCFEAPAGGEVVVRGRKLAGSAVRVHGNHILQHGAILLDWNGPLQAGAMGLADDRLLRPHVTTFTAELGRPVDRGELESALVPAFEDELGVRLAGGELTAGERQRETELEPEYAIATAEPAAER